LKTSQLQQCQCFEINLPDGRADFFGTFAVIFGSRDCRFGNGFLDQMQNLGLHFVRAILMTGQEVYAIIHLQRQRDSHRPGNQQHH
jgi:hypothetical protein